MPSPVTVDETRLELFYNEIAAMSVSLSLEFDLHTFNHKTVLLREHLDRLSTISTQVAHDLHRVSRELLRRQEDLKLEIDLMLANNMSVRSERTHAAQLARARSLLQDKIREINALEVQKADLDQMTSVITVKATDLRDTRARLRDQMRVFEIQHAGGRGLPAMNESVTDMDRRLEHSFSAVGSATVGQFLVDSSEEPKASQPSADNPNVAPVDLDSILSSLPSLEEIKQRHIRNPNS